MMRLQPTNTDAIQKGLHDTRGEREKEVLSHPLAMTLREKSVVG